jgi:hypothetical protein
MKRLNLLAMGVLGGTILLTGCTTMTKGYPINTPNVEILPLHRSEYVILGDTEGEACANYLLGGKLPWFSGQPSKTVNQPGGGGSFLASIPIIGGLFGGQRPVVNEALYNAIEKIPGTDSLMSMRIAMHKRYSVLGIYSEQCATVKGKAFEIKTDKE